MNTFAFQIHHSDVGASSRGAEACIRPWQFSWCKSRCRRTAEANSDNGFFPRIFSELKIQKTSSGKTMCCIFYTMNMEMLHVVRS